MGPDTAELLGRIANACWWVRYHTRNARRKWQTDKQRLEAIAQLALILAHGLAVTTDYEAILAALVEGLRPRDVDPPF